MARISGVNIPNEKRIVIGLTSIFGIGPARAKKVLQTASVDENIRGKDVTDEQANAIREAIDTLEFRLEGDLKRDVFANIKRLKEIKSYRGDRHTKRLPVRGQRTKTNTRTIRGNVRRTTGSGRRTLTKT